MVSDIKKLNFPSYATIDEATVTLNDMGESTITVKVRIDGNVTPDFSYDWKVIHNGVTYVHPYHEPQATKDNSSLLSTVELTFYHWAVYEMKRYFFTEMTSIGSGKVIADKYIASLSLPLGGVGVSDPNQGGFVKAFNDVLTYKFYGRIRMELNPDYLFDSSPTVVSISYTKIWDVLQKLYELYKVRWYIDAVSEDLAIIKVGYGNAEIDHVFEYSYEGGLSKYEQQVQDPNLCNVLLGRGGTKNIPYRYFKDTDPDNPSFPADPDWIPELADKYFDRLYDINFRYYVQGWKDHQNESERRYAYEEHWAYDKGWFASRFDPIEYVKDDDSIAKYGTIENGLSDNEDIYPTIQNVTVSPIGRVDETVAVEQVSSDDVEETAASEVMKSLVPDASASLKVTEYGAYDIVATTSTFEIPEGKTAVVAYESVLSAVISSKNVKNPSSSGFADAGGGYLRIPDYNLVKLAESMKVVNARTGEEWPVGGVNASGVYFLKVTATVQFTDVGVELNNLESEITLSVNNVTMVLSDSGGATAWKGTFDIWIKDLWSSERNDGESDNDFAKRAWDSILGDREGQEAKVVFSDGFLATSEDYEFTIVRYAYDTSKTLFVFSDGVKSNTSEEASAHGGISERYQSMWRLTLSKSDADLESTGLYVPSEMRQGHAGDHFFFTGIDMPHQYVLWAEERLNAYKRDELKEVSDILPTKVVSIDKVRAYTPAGEEKKTLAEQLKPGVALRVADKRFTKGAIVTVYVQSVTFRYKKATDKVQNLLPDIEVTLSNEVAPVQSTISAIQGDVERLHGIVGSISNVESIVRAVGDKLYLRKDGVSDRSLSATEFWGLLSSDEFRQGRIGGSGWGLYRDGEGNTVFEADRMVLRQSLDVTNLVIHQTEWVGGSYIESAAGMDCIKVEEKSDGYYCYFDQKQGTVHNLFKTGDVAYSQTYTADNALISYYKRKVTAVGEDYIVLSKTIKSGTGIPLKGDVIVQYGSYTDASRRYVKIRDVVGGGYERFIEGLSTVYSAGTEYYYAGKSIGSNGSLTSYRLFIGNKSSQYLEWQDNVLTVKGNLVVQSSNQSVEDFVTEKDRELENKLSAGRNYAQGTSDPKIIYPPRILANGVSLYNVSGLSSGDTCTLSFDFEYQNILFQSGTAPRLSIVLRSSSGSQQVVDLLADEGQTSALVEDWTYGSGSRHVSVTFQCTLNPVTVRLVNNAFATSVADFAYMKFSSLMLEKGDTESAWSPSPIDTDYLMNALKQSTEISGGLVQTSAIQLGLFNGNTFNQMAGLNGLANTSQPGNGLAFVAGGGFNDPVSDSETPATFGIRMDGTMWAANNTVRIGEEEVSVGDDIVLNGSGLHLMDSGESKFQVFNTEIDKDYLQNVVPIPLTANTSASRTFKISGNADSNLCWQVFSSSTPLWSTTRTRTGQVTLCLNNLMVRIPSVIPVPTGQNGSMVVNPPSVYLSISVNSSEVRKIYLNLASVTSGETTSGGWQKVTLTFSTGNLCVSFAGGSVTIAVMMEFDAGGSKTFYSETSACQTILSGKLSSMASQRTIIGNNGISSIWADGGMIALSDLFEVLYGDYGLKISQDGFMITTSGEGGWHSIE